MISLFIYTVILVASAFALSYAISAALVRILPKLKLLDNPNERSNHSAPVPRGGGIAVSVSMIGFLSVVGAPGFVLLAAFILAVLSFIDDMKGLSALVRLLVQVVAVAFAVSALDGLVFGGLVPEIFDKLLVGFIWIWFINAYNFMDGIDEITSCETVSICVGVIAISAVAYDMVGRSLMIDSFIILSAMLGFWWWNRHPAKIFLGDVGSIPLGLVIGYMLFALAAKGLPEVALILPAYYVVDAGITLLSRLLRGKKIWEAHSEHAYQKAVRAGFSHRYVVQKILITNIILICLAVACVLIKTAYVNGNEMLQGLLAGAPAYIISVVFIAVAYFIAFMLRNFFLLIGRHSKTNQSFVTNV